MPLDWPANSRTKNDVQNVMFLHMNLFNPVFKPQSLDLVICNGVLHHTSDPFLALRSIAGLVKEGGHVVLGLYNRYGRLPTDWRRLIFKTLGPRFTFLDPRLRDLALSETRKWTWFQDQYNHPHESKHTFGQVLDWFDATELEFVSSVPKAMPFDEFAPDERLFARNPSGSWLDHLLVEAGMLLKGGKHGGLFIMIGRKRSSEDDFSPRTPD
jgi:SAM-dependent methyltransferase